MTPRSAAQLLGFARKSAGLSQRQLARKAGTAQSVVARIELGETNPSWKTLTRLLKVAGFEISPKIQRIPYVDRTMLDDVPRILRLSPEQRLREVAKVSRFIAAAKHV